MPIDALPLLSLDAAKATLGGNTFGPFDFTVRAGERVAILGPSGAGKSTLLKLLSREIPARAGRVVFDGRSLSRWTVPELSRRRAVLPQSNVVAFGLQVELVVGLGRVACRHGHDLDSIVREALQLAHAAHLAGRRYDTLSGGEQARVQLARVFAQLWDVENGLVLVDEPLASLDPGLQFDLLQSIDDFARQRNHGVLAVLHDINHALRSFERLLLIKESGLMADVPAGAAALPYLESLYGIGLRSVSSEGESLVIPIRRRSVETGDAGTRCAQSNLQDSSLLQTWLSSSTVNVVGQSRRGR